MARIHVLDKSISELIAAGEVVERPSSIVKELIENSIDAGATKITIEIKGGGIGYIRITDDGSGINSEDIPNAFLRHGTSKVAGINDLDSIATLGFRGEALPSIAAVSKVEIITKTEDSLDGSSYKINGGEPTDEPIPTGAPDGTTLIIRDVFYNIPARMKFLKRDIAEGNAVAQVVDKCALSHPEIAFDFIRDGRSRLKTSGNGDLLAVIASVYDREFANNMIEVNYKFENQINVTGYIGSTNFSKPSRAYQNVFVNNRYVRTRTASVALEEAFKGKIMTGRFPVCVLNVDISFSQVDVNVHPAKIEVRFSDEKKIYNAVYFAVKNAISEKSDFSLTTERRKEKITPLNIDIAVDPPQQQRIVPEKTIPVYEKEKTESSFSKKIGLSMPKSPQTDKDGHKIVESDLFDSAMGLLNQEPKEIPLPEPPQEVEVEEVKPKDIKFVGELFNTYILLESEEDEFIIVDKHAAHERILYEEIKTNSLAGNRQVLLAGIQVTLGREEYSALLENSEELKNLGFLIEDFGTGTIIVRETPTVLDGEDVPYLLSEIAVKMLEGKRDLTPEVLDKLYFSIACKSALRGGDRSHKTELQEIIRRIEKDPDLTHCPHGRPVSVCLTKYELEKMFGRLG